MAKERGERPNRGRSTSVVKEAKGEASGLSRLEAEGGKLFKGMFDFLDQHIPGAPRKAREEAVGQAQKLFAELNRAFQEQARQLQAYEKRLETAAQEVKKSVDESVKRVLGRLDIATETEMKEVQKAVAKLRKDVNKLGKAAPGRPKGTPAGA